MGTQQRTRLREFSRNKSCVDKSSDKIKRGYVIFLVTKVASSKVPLKLISNKPKTTQILTNFKTILRIAQQKKNGNLIVFNYIVICQVFVEIFVIW
jgi:hypothetical protein